MARSDIEARVDNLETEVERLKTMVGNSVAPIKDWRSIVGTFADDPMFDEAMRLGREYRESLRPKPKVSRKSKR